MKHYDFEAVQPRRGTGSMKWAEMEKYDCPEGVIPFSVADMELKVMPEVVDGLKEFLDKSPLGYCNPDERFNAAVCRWERDRHGWDIRPEWLLGAPGVINAFFTAVHAFTAPGDGVLLLTPVYYPMYMAATRNDRQVVGSALINTNGYYTIDFADLEAKAKRPDVKLMILCSPHNPCGRVWERWELEKAMEVYRANDCLVISDEIWSDIILNGHKHIPTQSVSEDARSRTVAIYAPSKTFNLAGLVGSYHIIYNPVLRDRVEKEASLSHYNSMNVLSMHALIAAYSPEGSEWADELCAVLAGNIDFACNYIKTRFDGVEVTKPEGTYILFADCTKWCEAHGKTIDDVERACWDVGVAVQDGRQFHGPCHIRMNLALPLSRVQEAFDRLDKYVFNA